MAEKEHSENGLAISSLAYGSKPVEFETSPYPNRVFANLRTESISPSAGADHIDIEVGEYSLERLIIIGPHGDPKVPSGWQSFQVVGLIQKEANAKTSLHIVSRQVSGKLNQLGFMPTTVPEVEIPDSYWRAAWGRFVARSGQKNEWTIPLREELIRSIRASLTDEPKARSARNSDRSAATPAS